MPALPPVFVELKAITSEFSAKLGEAETQIEKLSKKGASSFDKLATAGKGIALGAGGAAIAIGGFALKMADDYEAAHARLVTAIQNSGDSFQNLSKPIGATEQTLQRFGFSMADVQDSLATLTSASHKPAEAIKEMSLAADIARGRHISLGDATSLLAKVETGHVSLLGRLGIATKDASGHTITQEEAVRRLSAMYGGQAAAYAQTFAGKMDALKTTAANLGAELGQKLIPFIQKLAAMTLNVVQWFEKHRSVAVALGIAIGGVLLVAVGAYAVAMVSAAAATVAATWPILAIIAAVAAIAYAINYAVDHWLGGWGHIKEIILDAWNWIRDHVTLIAAAFGPIGLAVDVLITHWRQVWSAIQTVVQDVWNVLSPIFGGIARGLADTVGAVGKVLSTGGKLLSHIPGFADGGWVGGPVGAPQLAVVHGGEYVLSRSMLSSGASAGGANGGARYATYNITSNDPQTVIDLIKQYERRNGTSWRAS